MLVQAIRATFRRWREAQQRRAAISELRALNDRTLKDMGLTRGEIVAAVHGWVYRGEPSRPDEPEPPSPHTAGPAGVEALDAAALEGHLERARRLRAAFVAGLLRRGVARLVRLLRRGRSAALRQKPARRPTFRGPVPLPPPAGHHRPQPMKESRHARRSMRAG